MAEGKKFVPGKGMVPAGKAAVEGKKGAVPPKKKGEGTMKASPIAAKKPAPGAKPVAKKPVPPKKK